MWEIEDDHKKRAHELWKRGDEYYSKLSTDEKGRADLLIGRIVTNLGEIESVEDLERSYFDGNHTDDVFNLLEEFLEKKRVPANYANLDISAVEDRAYSIQKQVLTKQD